MRHRGFETAGSFTFCLLLGACAGRDMPIEYSDSTDPRDAVEIEEMRITASRMGDGSYRFDSYDAATLFRRALRAVSQEGCAAGVRLYRQLRRQFPGSSYVSPALYNAGLCMMELDAVASIELFEDLLSFRPGSPDVPHARFQLARLFVQTERWEEALAQASAILERSDLSTSDRMEALARRAQAALGAGDILQAARFAERAVVYARTRPPGNRVQIPFFIGAANFVLAETYRRTGENIPIPIGRLDVQREALERRAQHILDAQREYFDTIRHTDPYWASAAGYQIGSMYDALWDAIIVAPVPPPRQPIDEDLRSEYEEAYREELKRLVEPLLRHSIRYWELTLAMIERTGVDTEWGPKIREDLARVRQRLLTQSELDPASYQDEIRTEVLDTRMR
ncbi:MAG: hypothetical protein AAF355_16195 [Myxococcota bacterium]